MRGASKSAGKGSQEAAGGDGRDARTARLEQALRANLRRRKAQTRARADAEGPGKKKETPE